MRSSLPGMVSKVTTMADNTVRITFDSQESPPEVMADLFQLKGKLGWMFLHEHVIKDVELNNLPELRTSDREKTPAERLRSVLYVLYKQGTTNLTFDDFYKRELEAIIDSVKAKLN